MRSASGAASSASRSRRGWATRRRSSRQVATTTTSGSTRGSPQAARRRLPGRRVSTTSPSGSRTASHSRKRCTASSEPGFELEGASDHGVSEAIYLRDPDGNGVELYRDRPREDWPRQSDGESLAMFTRPLDLQALLAEAELSAVRSRRTSSGRRARPSWSSAASGRGSAWPSASATSWGGTTSRRSRACLHPRE